MAAKFTCTMCEEDISYAALIAHIPRCYRSYCIGVDIKPLCTCDGREGRQTHPNEEH